MDASRASTGPKRPPRPERSSADPRPNGPDPTLVSARPASFGPPIESGHAPAVVAAPLAATAIDDRIPVEVAAPTSSTIDASAAAPATPVPASKPRSGRQVRRGRRVRRVVRRIDLWSVLKLSLVVYTCLYIAVLATLAALWGILYQSGNVDKLQSFLSDVGLENFTFYGNQMFRACAAIGAVGVMAGTVVTVLATALINVISEMTGGIRLVVIEEDVQG